MSPSEDPIQPGQLVQVVPLKGGQKGKPFVLKNTANEEVVVKFQNEAPAEALAGSYALAQANAATPEIRLLRKEEVETLKTAVLQVAAVDKEVTEFLEASTKFQHAVVMGYVKGETLKAARKQDLAVFLTVICDTQFQMELGKILAADALVGNADRMFGNLTDKKIARQKVGRPKKEDTYFVEGWYHEQNTLIRNKLPVAIDNGFKPDYVEGFFPFGRYIYHVGLQFGSFASSAQKYAEAEAGALFDVFLSTALLDHPNDHEEINVTKGRRQSFVEQVSRSATDTMKILLTRGKHWRQHFRDFGIANDALDSFRKRKRILRMLAAGVAPDIAITLTGNHEYHKWVLTTEFGETEAAAEEMLKDGVERYRALKQARLNQQ